MMTYGRAEGLAFAVRWVALLALGSTAYSVGEIGLWTSGLLLVLVLSIEAHGLAIRTLTERIGRALELISKQLDGSKRTKPEPPPAPPRRKQYGGFSRLR